jgi:hypothetical protein
MIRDGVQSTVALRRDCPWRDRAHRHANVPLLARRGQMHGPRRRAGALRRARRQSIPSVGRPIAARRTSVRIPGQEFRFPGHGRRSVARARANSGQSRFTTPWSPYLTPPDSAHPASTRLHSNTSSRRSEACLGAKATRDASSLLWRLQLRGNGSQPRWREVTAHWLRRSTLGNRAFELVHAVMALAASRQHTRAREVAKRLKSDPMLRARSGHHELALAQPLTAAIMSFCRGNYEGAVASISAIRTAADRCGGSVAQCDLIHLTLLEAALRAQQTGLARTLANERAARKPGSRLNRWLRRGRGHSASRGGRRDSCSMDHVAYRALTAAALHKNA